MTFDRTRKSERGFTFVELLVGSAMAAMFLATAVMTLQAVNANSKSYSSLIDVTIGTTAKRNFYDSSGSSIRCYAAPNYGLSGKVIEMRDRFREDISRADGVYCLPRSDFNSVRPEFLQIPEGTQPTLDTPEAFRNFLATSVPTSAATYDSYRNVPAATEPNLTIFMVGPEVGNDYMRVIAIYEIDLVTPTNISGVYASVRRYYNDQLTNYYDIFYHDGPNAPFAPLVVAFESESRLIESEGTAIDQFKVAPRGPFYLVWWPDPALNPFERPVATVPTTGPVADYGLMSGKTSYQFAVPVFPSLWGGEF